RTGKRAKRSIRCRHDGTMHGLTAARYFSRPRTHNRGFTLEALSADDARCSTSEVSLNLG
ncbi:MAG TPA: hypothetical protein VFK02_07910, partial [Kofleriaceae bacterium]|nr:hypothetical protein [Kofleriaceae bacterium]